MNSVTAKRTSTITSAMLAALVLTLAFCASSAVAAPGAIDAYGKRALPNKLAWSDMVSKARKAAPKMKIYGVHPQKTKSGLDYFEGLTVDPSASAVDFGPTADSYRCDDGVTNYSVTYHTRAYQKWLDKPSGKAPISSNVIVENATPRPCNYFFDRIGISEPYTANVFTPVGNESITYTVPKKKNGKTRATKTTAPATIYKSTSPAASFVILPDCVLSAQIGGTAVTINANGGGLSYEQNCNLARKFGNALSQLRYVKK